MGYLGLDIGGANLKAASSDGRTASVPFPMWIDHERLTSALSELISRFPETSALAVTMTGELADCFATKAHGVEAIVRSAQAAAEGRPTRFYQTSGKWGDATTAIDGWRLTAAANWHALAAFVGRKLLSPRARRPESAIGDRSVASRGGSDQSGGQGRHSLLVDIGSTTADLIPIIDGQPAAQGTTDPDRLVSGELVYTGVERSPICAVVSHAPWRGGRCPIAKELFATMRDVYVILGDLPEDANCRRTADNQLATADAAHTRLARLVCADRTMFSLDDARRVARFAAAQQLADIGESLRRVATALFADAVPEKVVISGQGEFLARRAVELAFGDIAIISLRETLGAERSLVATAYALAMLAEEDRP